MKKMLVFLLITTSGLALGVGKTKEQGSAVMPQLCLFRCEVPERFENKDKQNGKSEQVSQLPLTISQADLKERNAAHVKIFKRVFRQSNKDLLSDPIIMAFVRQRSLEMAQHQLLVSSCNQ